MRIPPLFDPPIKTTTVECFIKDKRESFFLWYHPFAEGDPVRFWEAEPGQAAADFLYDANFQQVIAFLASGESLIEEINHNPKSIGSWRPLTRFVYNLLDCPSLHPFYYPAISTITNAYAKSMQDEKPSPLPVDFLSSLAASLKETRDLVSYTATTCFDREDKNQSAIEPFMSAGLFRQVKLSDMYIRITRSSKDLPDPTLAIRPQTLEDLWNYLCFEYLNANVFFTLCPNCNRYFATTGRGNVKYCNRTFEDTGKTCREIMPVVVLHNKWADSLAEDYFKRTYKTMYSRVSAHKITKEQFKVWSEIARQKRDECKEGKISLEEFDAWLQSDEYMRLI